MTPDELLAAAKDLMQRPDTQITGIWPRAAALLARQALEAAMAEGSRSMIGTTTEEVLRAYSYQVAGDWYATVAARKALARTVEPVPVRDTEVLFFTERAVIPAASDSVNASRGISPRRPMRGPNVVLLPTMKV